jgi:uncharacterized protein YndB with AHSA1/START domain
MATNTTGPEVQDFCIVKEVEIDAPVEVTFEAMLDELGPSGVMPGGTPIPMVLEPWPGGRWFRDLGGEAGHFWGHVQVIKPPGLLELCGPLFMSFPALNHVQYRLRADAGGTRLTLTHRAFGPIPQEVGERVGGGWAHGLNRIRENAERRNRQRGNGAS